MDKEIFKKQISFKPEIINNKEINYTNVVVGGMGGSALPALFLSYLIPSFPIKVHRDFELPEKLEKDTLYIAISYSGNTAETLSFAKEVINKKMPLFIVTSGGELADIAENNNIPYVLVPSGFQPRDAILYTLKGLLSLIKKDELIEEINKVDISQFQEKEKSKDLGEYITLIYSSKKNSILGYFWKITLSETGKLPAFNNVFPELTHNEMQGVLPKVNSELLKKMKALILLDEEDSSGVKKEMEAYIQEAENHNLKYIKIKLPKGRINKFFTVWINARETAHILAEQRNISADEVAIIESFKKRLK